MEKSINLASILENFTFCSVLKFLNPEEYLNVKCTSKILHQYLSSEAILRDYYLNTPPQLPKNRSRIVKIWEHITNLENSKRTNQNEITFNTPDRSIIDRSINAESDSLSKGLLCLDVKVHSHSISEIKNSTLRHNSISSLDSKNFERIKDQISRDITRTFHVGRFKTDDGLRDLQELLEEVAISNPDIGYCQGMNFVVGALLEFTDDKTKVIQIFQTWLEFYDLQYLFVQVKQF